MDNVHLLLLGIRVTLGICQGCNIFNQNYYISPGFSILGRDFFFLRRILVTSGSWGGITLELSAILQGLVPILVNWGGSFMFPGRILVTF